MKVIKGKLPQAASINNYLSANYYDVYKCRVINDKGITADDIQVTFWTVSPKWIENLFKIRNTLVKPFGLKTEKVNTSAIENSIRKGENHPFFSLVEKSEDENIIRLTDKHLDAYFSVYLDKQDNNETDIYFTTVVNFKNKLGYAYFYTIYPFHHIVVKGIMRFCMKQLLEKKNILS